MPELVKAKLTEISADPAANPQDLSAPMEVQFNPSSLRLALYNQAEGGKTLTQPQRQHLGSGSRTLSLELVFDTADEGNAGQPRSVREKTALVERFALPRAVGQEKQAPPKARFEWGPLELEGIVENVGIEIDHFAADGTPLRARCSLTIREQDPSFALLESGAGANTAGNVPTPTAAMSGAVGTSGSGSARIGVAIGGETLADFSARMGVDPAAWRGLAAGLDGTLALDAGMEIGFGASVGAGLGLGVAPGLSAGASATLEASFGLESNLELGLELSAGGRFGASLEGGFSARASSSVSLGGGWSGAPIPSAPGSGLPAPAGFSLSAAGGVAAAIDSVKTAYAEAGQRAARAAFADSTRIFATASATGTSSEAAGVAGAAAQTSGAAAARGGASPVATPPASSTAPARRRPGMPQQSRPPLVRTGLPGPGRRSVAAPARPQADLRAVSFGLGVPLRPSYGEAARDRAQGNLGSPATTGDPQVPRWRMLPNPDAASSGTAAEVYGSTTAEALDCLCACPHNRPRR